MQVSCSALPFYWPQTQAAYAGFARQLFAVGAGQGISRPGSALTLHRGGMPALALSEASRVACA